MKIVKVFLCIAMSDRTRNEIQKDIDIMEDAILRAVDYAEMGQEVQVEFVHNFDCVRPEGNTQKAYFIGEAIKKLGDCDILYYIPNARRDPGCRTELDYCKNYGIPTRTIHYDAFRDEYSTLI